MRWVVVGNPGHRRVELFQTALAKLGEPPARVVAWLDLAEGRARLALAPGEILRIDSAGENTALERALIRRGETAARDEGRCEVIGARGLAAIPDELGRILYPRQQHLGFLAVLRDVEREIGDAPCPQPPRAIEFMFDKVATSRAWSAAGIRVPEALPGAPVREPDELRARMEAIGWPVVFVKMTSGSSASCLAVFTHRARGADHVITTVEDTGGGARYNTRRLQRFSDRRRVDRALAFILGEGAQVERAIAKARVAQRYFDLRVLAIDGEIGFVVMRTSEHPITNLNLGGLRGDVAALRAEVSAPAWDAAMASCLAVQRGSGAFHVGVDCMFEVGLAKHRIIEGNAFGDLLPNLERDGQDVYGWQIQRWRARSA